MYTANLSITVLHMITYRMYSLLCLCTIVLSIDQNKMFETHPFVVVLFSIHKAQNRLGELLPTFRVRHCRPSSSVIIVVIKLFKDSFLKPRQISTRLEVNDPIGI